LPLAALAQEPFILIDLPHSREYFLSLFRQAGVAPRIAHATPSIEMVRSLVANGLGVSLLTTRPVRDWSYDGKRLACRRLRGPLAAQSVVMAYPERLGAANPRAALFARVVRECFTQQRDAMTAPEAP
ncbi:MAG TPA: LysR substrate-binding domain-containing protein, partial [Alicycliphilus sp.]|nr:LysR substrate-binding domain-containing protein [Alicycliphilus sp.]